MVLALLCLASGLSAHSENTQKNIEVALSTIRSAALQSKSDEAMPLLSDDLVLISQSGKLYGKEAVLFDLKNGFEAWNNSDIVIRDFGDIMIVTLINQRTRTNMAPAKFRVLQMWRKTGERWLLATQSSTRIKK